MIYKHKKSGELLRPITQKYGANRYVVVDENNNPILEKSLYSAKMFEVRRVVKGFENLELYKK